MNHEITLPDLDSVLLIIVTICGLVFLLGMILLCDILVVGTYIDDNCVGAWESPDSTTYLVFNPDGTGYIKSDNVSTFVWTKLPNQNFDNFGLDYRFTMFITDTKSVVTGIIYGKNINVMYCDNAMIYTKIKK